MASGVLPCREAPIESLSSPEIFFQREKNERKKKKKKKEGKIANGAVLVEMVSSLGETCHNSRDTGRDATFVTTLREMRACRVRG